MLAASRDMAAWIERNPVLGGGLFLLFATLGKVTPVPGGVPVMLTAGFLFGPAVGPVLASLGSAFAAVGVTATGRWVFPGLIARIRGSRFARYEEALARDGIAYLAAIRILPIVPAWVGNLLPVAVDIRLRWVFLATLGGVAPLTVVVAGIGSRLQSLTEAARFDIALVLDPATLLPLLGLLAVALLPVAVRRWWRREAR
ncbi:MAG: VTT domain-containing protein [Thalassobaculum sp.]|uniref:TVP38/TMEM64 family protein n=1 Tax=Thalassobaculum sp. TaxID=2022740 RepID=UPI0032F08F72